MRKIIVLFICLLVICNCSKKEEKSQVTSYAKEVLAKKTPRPERRPDEITDEEKKAANS